ncbi:MAG: PTS sugar transporter subunit IIA [Alphaproteobacteria bacterium]
MSLENLIHANCVSANLRATSKKQLFQDMAKLLVDTGTIDKKVVAVRDIVAAAMERERLGSTGVGAGVALPHARIDGIDKVYAAFARLEAPLEYDAIDDRPVDLVTLLIAPSDAGGAHLRALAQISRRLRREDLRAKLRSAPNAESLYVTLIDDTEASAV